MTDNFASSKIISFYQQMVPIDVIFNEIQKLNNWPSLESQEQLVNIISSELLLKYPPCRSWTKAMFKKLEQSIELFCNNHPENEDIYGFSDSLMNLIIESKIAQLDDKDTGYVTYCCLSELEHFFFRIFRSHNPVGTKIWQAGIALTEVMIKNMEIFANKTVLELGAGVGITGVMIGKATSEYQLKKVFITDYGDEIIENMEFNVNINNSFENKNETELCVMSLDWNKFSHFEKELLETDVLIAADCTYSEDLNEQLTLLFEFFFDLKMNEKYKSGINIPWNFVVEKIKIIDELNESNENLKIEAFELFNYLSKIGIPLVLIACTERNPDTFQHFLGQIKSCDKLALLDLTGWSLQVLDDSWFYYENKENLHFFCIFPILQLQKSHV